jgi:hypothetical protein
MASNIIDALVCLIVAKGEFVSPARLKDVLRPEWARQKGSVDRQCGEVAQSLLDRPIDRGLDFEH